MLAIIAKIYSMFLFSQAHIDQFNAIDLQLNWKEQDLTKDIRNKEKWVVACSTNIIDIHYRQKRQLILWNKGQLKSNVYFTFQ